MIIQFGDDRRRSWVDCLRYEVGGNEGASATNERCPEVQPLIEAATTKPTTFVEMVVHSFSHIFRDNFELEFHIRKLAKNGVNLLSIAQEVGMGFAENIIVYVDIAPAIVVEQITV